MLSTKIILIFKPTWAGRVDFNLYPRRGDNSGHLLTGRKHGGFCNRMTV